MIEELIAGDAEVAEVCRRLGVRRLAVFGSAADGDGRDARDVDFLVEFDPDVGTSRFDAYFELKEALERIVGRPVDLVAPAALANPYFAAAVERSRRDLYAA